MKPLATIRLHYRFFRFLKTHKRLRHIDFAEWHIAAGSTWEFVSDDCRIIIILQDAVPDSQIIEVKKAGFQVLCYDQDTWQEFPDIIAEDIAQMSSYQLASHSCTSLR